MEGNLLVGLEMREKKSGDLATFEEWLLQRQLAAEHHEPIESESRCSQRHRSVSPR